MATTPAPFELRRPATLAEAAAMLAEPGTMPLAGGTDLVPNLRRGLHRPQRLVDLSAVPGFAGITHDAQGWHLGAGTTLAAIGRDTALGAELPALIQAAAAVAGPGHRSAATIGGNLCQDTRCIYYNQSQWWRQANGFCLKRDGTTCHVAPQGHRCHAAFEGDLAPVLLVLAAEVDIVSASGSRRTALATLYRDDGAAHLTLQPGEILAAVHLPPPAAGSAIGYRKARTRGAMDFPLAAVAMRLRMDGPRLAELALAVSGTDSYPWLLPGAEALLGREVDDALVRALGKAVQKQAGPMRSTVTASHHRRLVAAAAAERLLRELAGCAAPATID